MTNMDRQTIEKRIYELSRSLEKDPANNCYDSLMIDQFLETWHALAAHYRNNPDTEISVVTVREYLRWAHTFGAYAQSQTVDENCREISTQARDELSGFIEDILIAVADKLNLPD